MSIIYICKVYIKYDQCWIEGLPSIFTSTFVSYRIVDMYDRMHHDHELFNPFLLKQWYFSNENTQKLLKRMTFKDRELFNFDIVSLNWQMYFPTFARGIRVYLLKDPMSTTTEGLNKQQKKLWIQLISAAFVVAISYIISKFIMFRIIFKWMQQGSISCAPEYWIVFLEMNVIVVWPDTGYPATG